jgi:hypothetical protein
MPNRNGSLRHPPGASVWDGNAALSHPVVKGLLMASPDSTRPYSGRPAELNPRTCKISTGRSSATGGLPTNDPSSPSFSSLDPATYGLLPKPRGHPFATLNQSARHPRRAHSHLSFFPKLKHEGNVIVTKHKNTPDAPPEVARIPLFVCQNGFVSENRFRRHQRHNPPPLPPALLSTRKNTGKVERA